MIKNILTLLLIGTSRQKLLETRLGSFTESLHAVIEVTKLSLVVELT